MGFEIADWGGIAELSVDSTVDFAKARRGGNLLVVDDEIMAYSALLQLPNGHWYVKGVLRGVFDTVPRKHTAQSNLFFIRSSYWTNVTTGGPVCKAGEIVTEEYNITTSTVDHHEEFDFVKVKRLTTSRRPELPCVPGRIRLAYHLKKESIHTEEIAGPLTLSWTPRNKRAQFGCVSQSDAKEYWTQQDFAAPEDVFTMIKVSVGAESKEYVTQKIEDQEFLYTWEARCKDFKNLMDETRIEIFAKQNDLLSYQPQQRRFKWNPPVMVEGKETELEAMLLIYDWSLKDRVKIPEGPVATQQQVLYTDMPILILGEKTRDDPAHAILCYDGSFLAPNGQILIITEKNVYELYTMQEGFTFDSYFVPAAAGGKIRYQWDGEKINTVIGGV